MFRRDWVDWICSVIPAVAWWLEKAHWLDRRFFADQPTPPCAADAGANAIKVMPRDSQRRAHRYLTRQGQAIPLGAEGLLEDRQPYVA